MAKRTALYSLTLSEEDGNLYMTLRRRSRFLLETPVFVAPRWSSAPVISSAAQEGVTATFISGVLVGVPVPSVSYRWHVDGVAVGSVNTPYTPSAGDVGKTLTVVQTATSSQGTATVTSAGVAIIAADSGAGDDSSDPVTLGDARIVFQISLTSVAYAGVEFGISPAYTWSLCTADASSSHTLEINETDGLVAGQLIVWRTYRTDDPDDNPESRTYIQSGSTQL